MAGGDLPAPEPTEVDEDRALELQRLRDGNRLQGRPQGDQRCDACLYYLSPDDPISYCWHPSLRILVGADWWCQRWEPAPS